MYEEVEPLEVLMEKVSKIAIDTIKEMGEFGDPLWVMMKPGFTPISFEKGFKDNRDKRLVLMAVKMLFAQHKITQYVVACEAWLTKISLVDDTEERSEILSVIGVSKGAEKTEKVIWTYEMKRMESGAVTFGERDAASGGEGEFASLLD